MFYRPHTVNVYNNYPAPNGDPNLNNDSSLNGNSNSNNNQSSLDDIQKPLFVISIVILFLPSVLGAIVVDENSFSYLLQNGHLLVSSIILVLAAAAAEIISNSFFRYTKWFRLLLLAIAITAGLLIVPAIRFYYSDVDKEPLQWGILIFYFVVAYIVMVGLPQKRNKQK